MNIGDIEFRYDGGLWIAGIFSRMGHQEVLLSGTRESVNQEHFDAFLKFNENLDNNLIQTRKKMRLGFLYRPIRIAPNNENRIGVQFINRITGKQVGMIFWD